MALRPTRWARSLQARLLLTYLALVSLGLGGLILSVGVRLQQAAVDTVEHDLEIQSFVIANALRDPLHDWLEDKDQRAGRAVDSLIQSYAQEAGVRVTLTDPRLNVRFSSYPPAVNSREERRPELAAALAGAEQHDIRWDEWQREERLFVAAPVLDEDGRTGAVVQLSMPTAPIYADMRRTWLSLLAMAAVVLGVTTLVSLSLARQIARPIQSLTRVTEAMAAGDLTAKVSPAGPDEIERLARAFNVMAERVRTMLAREQEFSAHAAHELRSPLTSLSLRLEMLQTYQPAQADMTAHYLAQMDREVKYLQRVVDHLLTLAALDEDQQPPRTTLDLAPLLYEVADQMTPLVQQAGLSIRVDAPPHLPPVCVNPDQMRIVVTNLLDNAIKYTPAGGHIVLTAGGDNDSVTIAVADTGIGIPADALPHIFERFYRVDKARSRKQGGAGLGLALVHSIVTAHGGVLDVASQPDHGATFTVRLPRRACPSA